MVPDDSLQRTMDTTSATDSTATSKPSSILTAPGDSTATTTTSSSSSNATTTTSTSSGQDEQQEVVVASEDGEGRSPGDVSMKDPTRSHHSPDNNGDSNYSNNKPSASLESSNDSSTTTNSSTTPLVLRIPLTRPEANSENLYPNLSKCALVQNGPDNISENSDETQADASVNISNKDGKSSSSNTVDDADAKSASCSDAPSRRASYIDVVGLSSDDLQQTVSTDTAPSTLPSNGTASPPALAAPATTAAADDAATSDASDSTSITTSTAAPVPVPCSTIAITGSVAVATGIMSAGSCSDGPSTALAETAAASLLPPAAVGEESEDKDSEDEDKLVIHESDRRPDGEEDDEVLTIGATKRTAEEDDSQEMPKKKVRLTTTTTSSSSSSSGGASTTSTSNADVVVNLSSDSTGHLESKVKQDGKDAVESKDVVMEESKDVVEVVAGATSTPSLEMISNAAQVDLLLAQVNRDLQGLLKKLLQKEEEWNALLRTVKEKEELAARLRRKSEVLRFQSGTGDLSTARGDSEATSAGGGLLAALAGGSCPPQGGVGYDSQNPLAMMSRLLSSSARGMQNSGSSHQINNSSDLYNNNNSSSNNSRSNASSPSVSIIDIHTRSSSSPVINLSSGQDVSSSIASTLASIATSHNTNRYCSTSSAGGIVGNLPDNIKNKLTRQLLGSGLAGSIKHILPKPGAASNGAALLSSLAGQSTAPNQTLAKMLSSGPNGPVGPPPSNKEVASSAALLGTSGALQATGYGPQGPTISVQQLIAAHRKDNPTTPPVSRGAKRGAWRQKYDNGGSKRGGGAGGRGEGGSGERSSLLSGSGIALSDPTICYNDMMLQLAHLTQQQQQHNAGNDKNNPGSPQISIIPVSDSNSGGGLSGPPYSIGSSHTTSSPLSLGGGLSVTPAPSNKHNPSPILEGSSALAKLLMESRGGNKQNNLLEQQQQQQLHQQVSSAGVSNSQYLTLSALLSGGSTTTVREKAAAAAAAANAMASAHQQQQGGDGRSKKGDSSSGGGGLGGSDSAGNPKCQGCHKVRAQFVCAGCGNQWYCSRECQVAAWDEHSERCNT